MDNKIQFSLIFFLAFNFIGLAQHEDLKQTVEALKADYSENFEMKYLNISSPDLGYIEDTETEWKDAFLLKGNEKVTNNIGNRRYEKYYFNVYAYETELDRQYALKDWMEDFIEGESIRPGRPMRTYRYANPTIILINDKEIITLSYDCNMYFEERFDEWKEKLMDYFGNDDTMVIEVLCDGPLEWTENAPDPRETRGLF